MNNNYFDVIIAGAGFAGAVCARVFADNGLKVLVIEKRKHIGGNAYDCIDENGVIIHKYGPHIFHTNNRDVFDYLSRFTQWNGYEHKVLANVKGNMLPVPFNFSSIDISFADEIASEIKNLLSIKYGGNGTVSILDLINDNDDKLSELGRYVYKTVFEKYTMKQWGMRPEEIDPATTARVPVRLSYDCRYFTDEYQGLPTDGYTAMFENILRHKNISLMLGTDCAEHIRLDDGSIYFDSKLYNGIFVYTGEVDVLLNCKFGNLPYRSLDFEFENYSVDKFQPCGTVNYTVDMPYTRITEFKHMTLQNSENTTILKEYSREYIPGNGQIPYYPIINKDSLEIYGKYLEELQKYKNLYLVGRLAEYKYYNMDQVVSDSLKLAEKCLNNLMCRRD